MSLFWDFHRKSEMAVEIGNYCQSADSSFPKKEMQHHEGNAAVICGQKTIP